MKRVKIFFLFILLLSGVFALQAQDNYMILVKKDAAFYLDSNVYSGVAYGFGTFLYAKSNGNEGVEKPGVLPSGKFNLVNGYFNGRAIHYYADGAIYEEGYYWKGLKDSLWKKYTREGCIQEQTNYHLGLRQGKSITFYPCIDPSLEKTGSVNKEMTFVYDKCFGLETVYNRNGSVQSQLTHDSTDQKLRITNFYLNGIKKSEQYYYHKIAHGRYTEWFPNGQIKEVGNYKKGQKDGEWKVYYPYGDLMSTRIFLMGRLMSEERYNAFSIESFEGHEIYRFPDFAITGPDIDTYYKVKEQTHPDTVVLHLDLGASFEMDSIVVFDTELRNIMIKSQFWQSLSLSAEGPHYDLLDWEHQKTAWQQWRTDDGKSYFGNAKMKIWVENPSVTRREVVNKLSALFPADRDQSYDQYGVEWGLSHFILDISGDNHVGKRIHKVMIFIFPMGC